MDIRQLIVALHMPDITPEVESLHDRLAYAKAAGTLTDEMLAECKMDECALCGSIVCPHGEPLHFHHDGCPACSFDEPRAKLHGVDCEKVPHTAPGGYLHLATDDGAYEVDGLIYCGRCHTWLGR